MQATTRAKLFLRHHLPHPIFTAIRFVADKTLLKIIPLFFRFRISNFRDPYMKKIVYKDFPFFIEIRPENGYLDAQIHAKGLYEPHIVKMMDENIQKGNVCVDIGANIGHHTILMSHFTGKDGKVHAYEPIPFLREQLSRSLATNNISNVTLHDVALSDSEGDMKLHLRKGNIGGSSFVNGVDTEELDVQVRTFDNQHIGKVNFMKIDVEGFEYHVLSGMQKTIQEYHPKIIFEWSPVYYRIHDESHGKKILQMLTLYGYTLIDIENSDKKIEDLDAFIREFESGLRSQTNILALPS